MNARVVAAVLLALLPVGAVPQEERWEIEVLGPATVDHGEMRFDGTRGRIVFESNDSAFVSLTDFVRTDSTIRFTVATTHRSFTGTVEGRHMAGAMTDLDGSLFTWDADRIPPSASRWPVPPRLTIRQIALGSEEAKVVVPGAWRALMPTERRLAAEYDSVAHEAGIFPWHGADLRSRSVQIQLGLDTPVRESMRRTLAGIASSTAADARFHQVFDGPSGLRVDLGDVALERAKRLLPTFTLDRAMTPIWKLAPGSSPPIDSAAVREVAWRFWSRSKNDTTLVRSLDSLVSEQVVGAADAKALMLGYDAAASWWFDAVRWLLQKRWIQTSTGLRSPQQLVAGFWNEESLPLPFLHQGHYGAPEAFPAPSVVPILSRLVVPSNAIAPDWLHAQSDLAEVLTAWRTLDWGEPFRVIGRGHSRYLSSPAVESRSHVGGLFAPEDRVLIDPGVPPVLAVAMITHEWQHLLLTARRLRGTAPGLVANADEIRLFEDNPWLAEGAAEWATDLILAPARRQAPILLAISQSRRLAIQELASDDPHILGYRLVRAAAGRSPDPAITRDRLVRWLHDLGAFARELGLVGKGTMSPLVLVRPFNAAVIPEVTFVFDGGAALDVHRRLRVSLPPLEH